MILLSSLTKVFTDEEPLFYPECCRLTGLYGETVSFQTACSFSGEEKEALRVSIDSPLEKQIRIRQVISVPSAYPAHEKRDSNYLRHTPGLYPDLLRIWIMTVSFWYPANGKACGWMFLSPAKSAQASIQLQFH